MLNAAKRLYENMPQPLMAMLSYLPQPFTASSAYRSTRAALQAHRNSGQSELERVQRQMLGAALTHAVETVPFYGGIWGKRYKREDILRDPLAALLEFPILSKEQIQSEVTSFLSSRVSPSKRYLATTGGSTGAPMQIWLSNSVWATEWAFVYDLLDRHGISSYDRRISLRGVRRISGNSRAIEENPVYKELRISPFHLTRERVREIASSIHAYRPKFIHGYPSAVRDLLTLLGDNNSKVLADVKLILLVSENLPPGEMDYLGNLAGCPVASFYGHSERACFAPWRHGAGLWVPEPQYGLTEVRDSKLVVTGFINPAMPLVRYDTGDAVVSATNDAILPAGVGFASIEGRWTHDYLVGRSGQRITMTALNTHVPEMRFIRKFQFVQDEPGTAALHVSVMPHNGQEATIELIRREFESKCAGELSITTQVVEDIPLSPAGKHKFIVRRIAA